MVRTFYNANWPSSVLRYIPFSTNASVGDTVSFVWGAGPHTVTSSSALEVCNKTTGPDSFASGMQNKSFVCKFIKNVVSVCFLLIMLSSLVNQVVNDTNPIWFYCGVPTHCQKGMFGGINIGQADPTGGSSMPSANVSSMPSANVSSPSSTTSSYMPLSSMMANITSMVSLAPLIFRMLINGISDPRNGRALELYSEYDVRQRIRQHLGNDH